MLQYVPSSRGAARVVVAGSSKGFSGRASERFRRALRQDVAQLLRIRSQLPRARRTGLEALESRAFEVKGNRASASMRQARRKRDNPRGKRQGKTLKGKYTPH